MSSTLLPSECFLYCRSSPFLLKSLHNRYDYAATKTGAVIIPCSGLDSIPSDVSVYLANKTLKGIAGPDTAIENSTSAWEMRGGVSGGTLHTSMAALEEVPRATLEASMKDYVLSPGKSLFILEHEHASNVICSGGSSKSPPATTVHSPLIFSTRPRLILRHDRHQPLSCPTYMGSP